MKTFIRLGIALSLLFFSLSLKAAPIAGGHISYRAIDSVTYVVTAQIFAECDSINPNVGDSLVVSWTGGSYTTAMSLLSITDVTGLPNHCPTGSGCWQGSALNIYEHRFTDTVDISQANGCTITFAYAKGTRSAFITTGPAGTDFYIYSTLNRCNGLNNSAHIILPPQFYIAVGQDASLSTGYTDTMDGDSIHFELVEPRTPVSVIGFSGSWSYLNPISYLGFPNRNLNSPAGLHFDSITGVFSFRPTVQNQGTVLTFEAIEYTKINGVTVEKGRTRLEYKVTVLLVNNNKAPKIYGSNLIICEGQQVCRIYSTDDADGDSTHITWDHVIPGATLSVDSGKFQKVTFCWTPTPADVSNTPHLVTLKVSDGTCTFNSVSLRYITVSVKPRLDTTLLEIEEKEVQCNTVKVKMKKKLPAGYSRSIGIVYGQGRLLKWHQDSIEFISYKAGWNVITVYINNGSCNRQEKDSVFISVPYTLQLKSTPDTSVCPGDSFTLAVTPLNGTAPFSYLWAPGGDTTQTIRTDFLGFGIISYTALIIDSNQCATTDTIVVKQFFPTGGWINFPGDFCSNDSPVTLLASPKNGTFSGPGVTPGGIFSPSVAGIGNHEVVFNGVDTNGCKLKAKQWINVILAPSPAFTSSTTIGGAPLSVNFVDQTLEPVSKRTWIFVREDSLITDTITSTSSTITKVFNDTGKYHVTLINYSGICDASITKNNYITVRSTVGINPANVPSYHVYPNPAKDAVIVEGENISKVELKDIQGKIIPAVIEKSANRYRVLSPGSSGVYVLQITNNENLTTSLKIAFIE